MKKLMFLLFIPLAFSLNAQEDKVFTIVENQPVYPGGMDALVEFIGKELKYPQQAIDKSISGTVFVSFVVDKSGEIRDAKVLRGIGGGCDEEALRVVGLMQKWKPGSQRGKAVNVQYNLPIRFKLPDNKAIEDFETENEEILFSEFGRLASFVGGREAFRKFLLKELNYPEKAILNKEEGLVWVGFVVKSNGDLIDFKVLKSDFESLNEEALRIAKAMPKWEPALKNGVPVKYSTSIPIRFELDKSISK